MKQQQSSLRRRELRPRVRLRLLLLLGLSAPTTAAPFTDATADWLDGAVTEGWSNKVELCDVDSDGDLDALFANGADYSTPGEAQIATLWRNTGSGFVIEDLAPTAGWWRVAACADVDNDGDNDVLLGGTFQSTSLLLRNTDGALAADDTALPAGPFSLGDAEFADVDGDLDLDLLLADWGDGDPFTVRGRPLLWLNDGSGHFVDETDARLPSARTGFSWDLQAIDADNDADLDVVVSCKVCSDGGLYFTNDGDGVFVDDSGLLPGTGNNYEYEVIDLDVDGDLDLFTINNGPDLGELVLRNDGGGFAIDYAAFAADVPNGDDDNAAISIDIDNDGDCDMLVGSLSGTDRVWRNDNGVFSEALSALDGTETPGTLGIAVGDLDDDGRLDLVMAQGESAFDDRVYRGADIPVDTQPPVVGTVQVDRQHGRLVVRVHDRITPVRESDLVVEVEAGGRTTPLRRAGELLWATALPTASSARVCATDRQGNRACSSSVTLTTTDDTQLGGGGCGRSSDAQASLMLPLAAGLWSHRRRRHTRFQRRLQQEHS